MKAFEKQWVPVFALLVLVAVVVAIDRTWFASDELLEESQAELEHRQTNLPANLSDGGAELARRHPHMEARNAQAVQRALELMVERDATSFYVRRAGDTMNGMLTLARPNLSTYGQLYARDDMSGGGSPYAIFIARTNSTARGICLTGTAAGACQTSVTVDGTLTPTFSSQVVVPSLKVTGASTADVKVTGTGWLELHGDTAANVEQQVPTAGAGAFNYDTSNNKMRVYENGNWNSVATSNPDAGAPFGPSIAFSGHNISTTANLKPLAGIVPRGRYRAESLGWNIETAGTGGGNATAIIRDIGGASNLCTATFLCALTTGSVTTATCSPWTPASAAGNEIDIRLDCSSCTTCPVANITASLTYMPGT